MTNDGKITDNKMSTIALQRIIDWVLGGEGDEAAAIIMERRDLVVDRLKEEFPDVDRVMLREIWVRGVKIWTEIMADEVDI